MIGLVLGIGFLLLFGGDPVRAASCSATCPGKADVIVDLKKKCMCLPGGNCFKVDIGKSGPQMTASGTGRLHKAEGAKYQTKPGPGTTGYDNDAIAMGIPANDNTGRWIHKTRACAEGGRQATKGCIGVPCREWPKVKRELSRSSTLAVCGGSSGGASLGGFHRGDEGYEDDGGNAQ